MGMAASQARYLSLVARKTNVEWEGQQINQARTALANKDVNVAIKVLKTVILAPTQMFCMSRTVL